MLRSHLWVVGHRGSPAVEVENTIASFEQALADGANALEVDQCVTADHEVIAWHDFDPFETRARLRQLGLEPVVRCRPLLPRDKRFLRRTDELNLAELRSHFGYAEGTFGGAVRARIPTLGEFMIWANRHPKLGLVFLDVKVPADREALIVVLVRAFDELVKRHEPRFRIVLEAPEAAVATALERHAPRYAHALDVEPRSGFVVDSERYSAARAAIAHRREYAAAQRPRGVTLFPFATHRRIVENDLERLRRHNESSPEVPLEALCSFTINDEDEMRTLVKLGVQAIQSDRPELLRRIALECGRSL